MADVRGEVTRVLFLEERIRLAREALNRRTLRFEERLPEGLRVEFHQLVMDLMTVLESGDPFGDARERLAQKPGHTEEHGDGDGDGGAVCRVCGHHEYACICERPAETEDET